MGPIKTINLNVQIHKTDSHYMFYRSFINVLEVHGIWLKHKYEQEFVLEIFWEIVIKSRNLKQEQQSEQNIFYHGSTFVVLNLKNEL